MMSALVSILFVTALCLALSAIALTWRTFGAEVLSLPQQLAACDPARELRFVTITTFIKMQGAELWQPGFRPLAVQPRVRCSHYRLARQTELRHAAA